MTRKNPSAPDKSKRARKKETVMSETKPEMNADQKAFADYIMGQLSGVVNNLIDTKIADSEKRVITALQTKFEPLLTALAAGGKTELSLKMGDGKSPIHVRMAPSVEQMKEVRIYAGVLFGGAAGALLSIAAPVAIVTTPVIASAAITGAAIGGFAMWFGYVWEWLMDWFDDTAATIRERREARQKADVEITQT